jgi:hypothetical protein
MLQLQALRRLVGPAGSIPDARRRVHEQGQSSNLAPAAG